MKTQFRQQVSEYDCVPTTFINALSYLFERDEIPPLVIQRTYLYCLDSLTSPGKIGHGTSGLAVQLLGQWLDAYRDPGFKVETQYCRGDSVHLERGNSISRCLNRGGVALLRVSHWKGFWHYVLGLSVSDGWVRCYDPYAKSDRSSRANCYEFLKEEGLHSPNLRISCGWMGKRSNQGAFHLGSTTERECLLLERRAK